MDYLFEGLRVLDVGSWIAGPVAATILGDYGADVIKVEIPGAGDPYRALPGLPHTPDAAGNYTWDMDARHKRSLALNLKTAEGIGILHDLIRTCDIYITNQPLPMRRELKLRYEDLQPLNPKMIFASLSAYGEAGPDKDLEAFDLVAFWTRSGLMDLVRSGDAPPAQSIPGMGDHGSAVSLYAAIVTALLRRERTGEGGQVGTSLFANGLFAASCIAQAGFAGGSYENYRRIKDKAAFIRRPYRTKDGRWLQVYMVRSDEDVARMLQVTGLGYLLDDPRFRTAVRRLRHADELADLFQAAIAGQDMAHWQALYARENVNVQPVTRVEDLADDEQIRAAGLLTEDHNGRPVIDHPVKVDGLPRRARGRAPDVGEHSTGIMSELGFTDQAIDALEQNGVIHTGKAET